MSGWQLFAVDAPDDDERWLEEFKKWQTMRRARREQLARGRAVTPPPDNFVTVAAGDD
jgi:hypothetical protein